VLPRALIVGSKTTLRNGGSTGSLTLLPNVCPSSVLRWRCPSTRWPKIS
jgi:hypothetical protein